MLSDDFLSAVRMHLARRLTAVHESFKRDDMPISHVEYKKKNIIPAIMRAMDRIKNGTYGVCVDCGSEIPKDRLMYIPEAERCVPCQEKKESK